MTAVEQHEIDNLKHLLEDVYQITPSLQPACLGGLQTVKKLQDQLDAVEIFNRQSAEDSSDNICLLDDSLDDAYLNEQFEQEEPW
jgi:hypothetical protein